MVAGEEEAMTEAKIIQENDDFIDVQIGVGLAEMEAHRGMSIKEWTDRYVAAAQSILPAAASDYAERLIEAAEGDFFSIEGGPEELGKKEATMIIDPPDWYLEWKSTLSNEKTSTPRRGCPSESGPGRRSSR
jgi:hypothetical protein